MEKAEYDSFSATFARSRKGMKWEEVDALVARLEETVSIGKRLRVLDVGCGSGRLYGVLKEKYGARLDYVGIDASTGLLSEASKEFPSGDFRLGRMESLTDREDLEIGSFDAVFAIASLHHVIDDRLVSASLRGFFQFLKPDGLFAMTNWNLLSVSNLAKYSKCRNSKGVFEIPFGDSVRHYRGFSKAELDDFLEHEKFRSSQTFANDRNLVSWGYR